MTRNEAIDIVSRQATETPMADPALVAGVIDLLASLDLIRFTPKPTDAATLTEHLATRATEKVNA